MGRSRYERTSPRTSDVITSSCVGPRQNSLPWRSVRRRSSLPYSSHLPVSFHSSEGITIGMETSCAPALFISERTMASTLRTTRRPIGKRLYMPAATFLIMPARIMSFWLMTSASAGDSFSVGRSIFEKRIQPPRLKIIDKRI